MQPGLYSFLIACCFLWTLFVQVSVSSILLSVFKTADFAIGTLFGKLMLNCLTDPKYDFRLSLIPLIVNRIIAARDIWRFQKLTSSDKADHPWVI